jgi:hypothetical protein
MSPPGNIIVTIYSFQLPGMPPGTYTLPPVNVKVAGKVAQALPLEIEVPSF